MSEKRPQDEPAEEATEATDGAADKASTGSPSIRQEEPIPRLPRGSGIRLTGPEVFRILFFAILLVGVLALRQPCSDGVGNFIQSFDSDDAGPSGTGGLRPSSQPPTTPGTQPRIPPSPDGYIRLTGDMSEEEIRAKLERAGVSPHDAGPVDARMPSIEP